MLGLRPGQLLTLGVGGALAMLALRSLPPTPSAVAAVLILVGAVGAAFWPLAGRPLQAWLPLLVEYGVRRLTGRHRFGSGAHLHGHLVLIREDGSVLEALPPEDRPAILRDLRFLEVETGQGRPVGVIKDARRHTYTGVLRVRGRSFNLLDQAGQAAAIEAWAAILAGYALPSSPISRLQWIERTLPDDGQAVARHFRERAAAEAPEAALRVYSKAIGEARQAARQHTCLLALRVDARRSWRQVHRAGPGDMDRGACTLLLHELASLAPNLEAAGIAVEAVLSPRALAEAIRSAYEPEAHPRMRLIWSSERWEREHEAGPHPRNAWPQTTSEALSRFEVGRRNVHATYHVREWPRIEVGPDFLAPLLLDSGTQRTVSMTLEPVPAVKAQRELRRALISDASDEHLRQRGGWLTTFRQLREAENAQRAERELADGHASYRFTGYVTVSAGDPDELEAACTEVEQAASRAHLELDRLYGQQELAFTYTLPLCEGLQ